MGSKKLGGKKMGKRVYIRSDGNGGMNISKSAIALISIILMLLSAIVPLVFGYGKLNEKVDMLDVKYSDNGISHEKIIKQLNEVDKKLAVIEERITNMGASFSISNDKP